MEEGEKRLQVSSLFKQNAVYIHKMTLNWHSLFPEKNMFFYRSFDISFFKYSSVVNHQHRIIFPQHQMEYSVL